jgi:hypothetical protein
MNDKLLEIDVRLLVLRYGRTKVLRTLARLGEQTLEDLENQLLAAEAKPQAKRPRPSARDVLASECHEHPDIAEPLRFLAVAFENRTFLPHLRDVRRFLDRMGSSSGKLKSRVAAAPTVIRTLAKLQPEDLARLAVSDQVPGESDYSLLARAIMGSSRGEPSDPSQSETKPTD